MTTQLLAEKTARDQARLLSATEASSYVILEGPSQSGKQYLLRHFYESLLAANRSALWIAGEGDVPLNGATNGQQTLVIPNIHQFSSAALLSLYDAVRSGGRVVASAHITTDECAPIIDPSPNNKHANNMPRLLSTTPFTQAELFALFLAERPPSLSIDIGIQCVDQAWGRPGWLLRMMQAISRKPDLINLLGE